MSKPRTLKEYVRWFMGWSDRMTKAHGPVNLGTVMKVARKRGYYMDVMSLVSRYECEVCTGTGWAEGWGTAQYEPVYAALRALYQAVEENE